MCEYKGRSEERRVGKDAKNFEKRVKEYLKLLKGKRRKPVPKLCHTSLATCGKGAVALRGSASAPCLGYIFSR